jgi:hypothetical protein
VQAPRPHRQVAASVGAAIASAGPVVRPPEGLGFAKNTDVVDTRRDTCRHCSARVSRRSTTQTAQSPAPAPCTSHKPRESAWS